MPRQAPGEPFQIPQFPPVAEHSFAFGATANRMTTAASNTCRIAAVYVDTAAKMAVGVAPVATTGSFPLPASTLLFIGLNPGHKVSFTSA